MDAIHLKVRENGVYIGKAVYVIHQIRNNLKQIASKDEKELTDLKKVYKASSIQSAELSFVDLKAKWDKNTQKSLILRRKSGLN